MVDPAHGHHDAGSGIGKYLAVFVTLCVLTGASFFTYSDYWPFKDTPVVGRSFMLAVSFTKAMLVIMFFMHLLWEANWKYVLTIPATFMSLFLLLMLVPDVGCRMNNGFAQYSEERLRYAAVPITESPNPEGGGEGDRAKHSRKAHDDGRRSGERGSQP